MRQCVRGRGSEMRLSPLVVSHQHTHTHIHTQWSLIGRIHSIRQMSKGLVFVLLKRGPERLQVSLHRKELLLSATSTTSSSTDFSAQVAALNLGDIVSVEGFPGKTHTGELTLMAREIACLAPCLHPLPKHQGLSDEVASISPKSPIANSK